MIDQQQALEFKTRLRERAEQLRDEVRQTRAKSIEETPSNVAERARDIEDDSFAALVVDTNLTEIERDVDELRMIDSALQRISAGTYGTCIDCGREIPLARLQAEPTAERDVECQELYEKTHASARTPSL
ncbi:TraR/DksA family transcriptional regulator [Peristeroidobacter soli]|jgi:RNA polymerase-binding protein DksA|uniref:TraR/DksA family transcriptional regulator n=1 Tax=Peristeroidobacter soli TaxID=2497877 RepID=UPI00101C08C7|nr:TraR/DksA family transcriptional regulator [Peristeroidobacter soli]